MSWDGKRGAGVPEDAESGDRHLALGASASLSLAWSGLTGETLHEELERHSRSSLAALRAIDLTGNALEDVPVDLLRHCGTPLRSLKLSSNLLTSAVALEDTLLGGLLRLDLSDNSLESLPRLAECCPDLEELLLAQNKLPSVLRISRACAGLERLATLDVRRNPSEGRLRRAGASARAFFCFLLPALGQLDGRPVGGDEDAQALRAFCLDAHRADPAFLEVLHSGDDGLLERTLAQRCPAEMPAGAGGAWAAARSQQGAAGAGAGAAGAGASAFESQERSPSPAGSTAPEADDSGRRSDDDDADHDDDDDHDYADRDDVGRDDVGRDDVAHPRPATGALEHSSRPRVGRLGGPFRLQAAG
ncbi:hypothetical protein FNF27_07503 [Cafeteria roenbergensis]|uniref:U2A'/phosphoprotein 32 family A C-terminal domain-containing protein n=1 Tax=Cafeteria roenbergensis TaxID=33653 RepID=A0A5A8DRN0_CAFRO|nr:hypothetical protein FNF27_07503 [Cafeteria roenbergensis]